MIGWVLWIADSERNFLARSLLESALRISLSVGAKEAGLSRGKHYAGAGAAKSSGAGMGLDSPRHPFADCELSQHRAVNWGQVLLLG